jgi:hypothetical protein
MQRSRGEEEQRGKIVSSREYAVSRKNKIG